MVILLLFWMSYFISFGLYFMRSSFLVYFFISLGRSYFLHARMLFVHGFLQSCRSLDVLYLFVLYFFMYVFSSLSYLFVRYFGISLLSLSVFLS